MGRVEPSHFNLIIGILAVSFVVFQVGKEKVFKNETSFKPGYGIGLTAGIEVGITSTFAHGAGPVVNIFMIPQKLPKVEFISTRLLIFTWINWIKMPVFIGWGLVTAESLKGDLVYLPLVPVGGWLGERLNRKISEEKFNVIIYILTLLAGLHLIIGSLSP